MKKTIKSKLFFLPLLVAFVSCQTTENSEKKKERLVYQKGNKAEDKEKTILTQLEGKKPRDHELIEYFLLADIMIQEQKFGAADQLLTSLFMAQPSLVVGLKLANVKMLEGKTAEAENIIRKVILFFPQDSQPYLELAFLLQIKGKVKESLDVLESALKKQAKNEALYAHLAETYIQLDKEAMAVKILGIGLKDFPTSSELLLKLAKIRVQQEDYVQAEKIVNDLIHYAPESIDTWIIAGIVAAERNQTEAAERYFREAYDKQPNNLVLVRNFVSQLLKVEKYQEARRVLSRLEDSLADSKEFGPDLTFQLAFALLQLKEFEQAKTRFLKLLDESKDQGRIYFFVGQCDEQANKKNDAVISYKKVTDESEFYTLSKQRIVSLYLDDGDLTKAQEEIGNYRKKNNLSESDFRFIAMSYARMNKFPEAFKIVKDALPYFPQSEELLYLKAAYSEFVQNRESAIKELKVFVQKHPNFVPALNHLGYLLAEESRDLEYAIKVLQRAVQLSPKSAYYYDSLGWAFFKKKDYASASQNLEKAAQMDPEEPVIWEHLGELHFSQGQKVIALQKFEKGLSILKAKPKTRVDMDPEWLKSRKNMEKRIDEIQKSALPP